MGSRRRNACKKHSLPRAAGVSPPVSRQLPGWYRCARSGSRHSADHACLPHVWTTHFNLYRQVWYRALSCLCVDRMICPSARKWRCYSASEWQPIPQTIRKMLSKKHGRLAMMRDVFSIVRLTTSFGDQSTRRMRGKLRRLLKCTL